MTTHLGDSGNWLGGVEGLSVNEIRALRRKMSARGCRWVCAHHIANDGTIRHEDRGEHATRIYAGTVCS